jgi:hypothetical protein
MFRSSQATERASRFARRLRTVTVLAVVSALAVSAGAAAAPGQSRAPRVVPPLGKIYDRLSVAWWQYVLAQPAASNPLRDRTGAGCGVGQSGPVFFLVGAEGTGQLTRDQCTVRAGKLLFFPLLNAFDVHTPGDGLDTPELVWNDLQVTLAFRVDTLHASVDGVRVDNLNPSTSPYRACAAPVRGCARPFSLTLPTGNLFGIPPGTYAPAVADGFYLLLAPLRPGVHTITFGGTGNFGGPNAPFSQNITYHLRVLQRERD